MILPDFNEEIPFKVKKDTQGNKSLAKLEVASVLLFYFNNV